MFDYDINFSMWDWGKLLVLAGPSCRRDAARLAGAQTLCCVFMSVTLPLRLCTNFGSAECMSSITL